MHTNHTQQGFIVLFTVFLSVIILTVALALTDMGLKQIQLSAAAREGHEAFFAADTGIECGLYWDREQAAFSDTAIDQITCAGETVSVEAGLDEFAESRFEVPLQDGEHCVRVHVYKNFQASDIDDGPSYTRIEAFGRNRSCGDDNDPQLVERALRVTYPN